MDRSESSQHTEYNASRRRGHCAVLQSVLWTMLFSMLAIHGRTRTIQRDCPPISQPMPLIRLVYPSDHAQNIAPYDAYVLLASNWSPSASRKSWPWPWLTVQLVPAEGVVLLSGPPILLSDGVAATYSVPYWPAKQKYRIAKFDLGRIQNHTNYRIMVNITVPEGKNCPSIPHLGIVGDFTTATK